MAWQSRGTKRPSEVFKAVMAAAKEKVFAEASTASAFAHRGIRGDERAAALAEFLRQRLPERYGIGKGEVLDFDDQRTGQLDIIVYDQASCAPISLQRENLLLPCEALYAVIEVKTTITQEALNDAFKAAAKVRKLRPFKKAFVGPRTDGRPADDDALRCQYVVFGYSSDISNDETWLPKEYARILKAADYLDVAPDYVDDVVVLDRGMVRPGLGRGKWEKGDDAEVFLESYLHIANFLARGGKRRQPVDWQMYAARSVKGWVKIRPE